MATTHELLECLAKHERDFAQLQSHFADAAHLESQEHELMDRIQVLIDRIRSELRQRQQREAGSASAAPSSDRRHKRKQELAAMRQRMQQVMNRLGL